MTTRRVPTISNCAIGPKIADAGRLGLSNVEQAAMASGTSLLKYRSACTAGVLFGKSHFRAAPSKTHSAMLAITQRPANEMSGCDGFEGIKLCCHRANVRGPESLL